MWVRAFQKGIMEVSANTNNGVQRKNRDFKYQYLDKFKDTVMIRLSAQHFLSAPLE